MPLDSQSVRYIVDLGGNVGFSSIFWAATYPNVEVLTFEPHPAHCALLRSHLVANGFDRNITLLEAAAGVSAETAFLTDADDASSVVDSGGSGRIEIKTVDIFDAVGTRPIDILKVDIEGSEYAILADERFPALAARVGCVLLEWHRRDSGHFGQEWCVERLRQNGFQVSIGRSSEEFGMIYGIRPELRSAA